MPFLADPTKFSPSDDPQAKTSILTNLPTDIICFLPSLLERVKTVETSHKLLIPLFFLPKTPSDMSTLLNYLGVLTAAYLAVTLVLFLLSSRIPAAGFFARLLAAYVSLLICAAYGTLVSIVLRAVGNGRIAQWATGRSFKYMMWYTTGITFTVEDPNDWLNTTRPAVFIGNHQTELDVLMLGCIFPKYCSVTAKKSLKNVPFLGWFMTLSGSVFIDRNNPNDARAAMAGAANEMKSEKQSVYMFPEGTRSYSKEPMLLPFKKGAFHLAVQAGVPIVPVVAANYSDILYVKDWIFKSGTIPVKGTNHPIVKFALG
jgi:lysophosphatidate acyltransferase